MTVRRLVQSPTLQSTIFCGVHSDLRGKGIRVSPAWYNELDCSDLDTKLSFCEIKNEKDKPVCVEKEYILPNFKRKKKRKEKKTSSRNHS